MRITRNGLVALTVLMVGSVVVWPFIRDLGATPGCTVTADPTSVAPRMVSLTGEQADNAATIAAIGI